MDFRGSEWIWMDLDGFERIWEGTDTNMLPVDARRKTVGAWRPGDGLGQGRGGGFGWISKDVGGEEKIWGDLGRGSVVWHLESLEDLVRARNGHQHATCGRPP